MASILFTVTAAHGHIVPTLTVAKYLQEAGHDVRYLTSKRYENAVRQAGLKYLPIPEDADVNLADPNETFPERADLSGIAEIRFSVINLFLRPGAKQLEAIDEALATQKADIVIADPMFIGAVLLFNRPRSERPTVITLGITPLPASDPDVAPFGLGLEPLPGLLGRLRNQMLSWLSDNVIFAPVNKAAKELFQETLGWVPQKFSIFNVPANTDHVFQLTVPSFEYPRSSLPPTVRFTGPPSRAQNSGLPTPDWWDDLDSGLPVVHVTQGTVANENPGQLIWPTFQALANEKVLVVATAGGHSLDSFLKALPGQLPANARVGEYLPYDVLLPKTSVFVTNGGYGGLHAALEHGVPIVAGGATEDKLETTARVGWSGAGINLNTAKPQPRQLRDAVHKVLSDPKYQAASAKIGAEIAASPGLEGIAREIEQIALSAQS